ncbi:MAG: hypothetical protein LUC33_04905 [Prevotellaceae bacterium]|nr:hypothetical protein [Prevotellaceae bacterium]
MAETRRRINLSVDPELYGRLDDMRRRDGFPSLPRMVTAFCRLCMALRESGPRAFDIPEDEADWLAAEFDRLSEAERERPGWRKAGPFNEYTK